MPPPGAPAQIFDREPERRSRSPSGRHCVRSEVYLCGCCANGKRHCVWGMSVLESICRTLSVPESMETLHSALEFGCSTKDHCIDEAAQHGDHVRGTLSLIFYAHAAATVRHTGHRQSIIDHTFCRMVSKFRTFQWQGSRLHHTCVAEDQMVLMLLVSFGRVPQLELGLQ